ncbi:MAG: hypothetical protein AAF634_09365 [Bacteroidota bacterium]
MGRVSLANIEDSAIRKAFLQDALHESLLLLETRGAPKWGLMQPQQMVEHLIWAFDISIGRVAVVCTTPEDEIPRFKKFLFSDMPTRRNFKNPVLGDQPLALLLPDLPKAKSILREKADEFYEYYAKDPTKKEIHPVFGALDFEEWERNHFKHSIHHLEQFDLLLT